MRSTPSRSRSTTPASASSSCRQVTQPCGGLRLLVRHDDAEREFAYDAGSEKALDVADKEGWTVVSMKTDWTTVFDQPSG